MHSCVFAYILIGHMHYINTVCVLVTCPCLGSIWARFSTVIKPCLIQKCIKEVKNHFVPKRIVRDSSNVRGHGEQLGPIIENFV